MTSTPAKKKKPRNRAAQDTTLINLRALHLRVAKLEGDVKLLKRLLRGTALFGPPLRLSGTGDGRRRQ